MRPFGWTGGSTGLQQFKTEERGDNMIQKELNEENKEIMSMAHDLYVKHGFKDGNAFVDWLEAEKQMGRRYKLARHKQLQYIFFLLLWGYYALS